VTADLPPQVCVRLRVGGSAFAEPETGF